MRRLTAAAAALSLAACATTPLTTGQRLEQADTAASLVYAATATAANAYEALPSTTITQKASAEALKQRAWGALLQERELYAAGQDISGSLEALQALEAQAKGL